MIMKAVNNCCVKHCKIYQRKEWFKTALYATKWFTQQSHLSWDSLYSNRSLIMSVFQGQCGTMPFLRSRHPIVRQTNLDIFYGWWNDLLQYFVRKMLKDKISSILSLFLRNNDDMSIHFPNIFPFLQSL